MNYNFYRLLKNIVSYERVTTKNRYGVIGQVFTVIITQTPIDLLKNIHWAYNILHVQKIT